MKKLFRELLFVLAAILMLPTWWDSKTILSNVTIILGYGIYGVLVFSDKKEILYWKIFYLAIMVGLIYTVFFSGDWMEYYNWRT
jgi:hypothetical protein